MRCVRNNERDVNTDYNAHYADDRYRVDRVSCAYLAYPVSEECGAYCTDTEIDESAVSASDGVSDVNAVNGYEDKVRAAEETARTFGRLGVRFGGFRQAQ